MKLIAFLEDLVISIDKHSAMQSIMIQTNNKVDEFTDTHNDMRRRLTNKVNKNNGFTLMPARKKGAGGLPQSGGRGT